MKTLLLLLLCVPAFGQNTVIVVPPTPIPLQGQPVQVPNIVMQLQQAKAQEQAIRNARQQEEMLRVQTEQQQLVLERMKRYDATALPYPQPRTGQLRVEDSMTASDFRKAGLEKLTPDELAALNTWLSTRLAEVVQTVRSQQAATAKP